jgi:ABC-type nitrate/sulfonate/bicarbonate transport system permease component
MARPDLPPLGARARGRTRRVALHHSEPVVLPLATFVLVILAWEWGSRSGLLTPLFFASPSLVLEAAITQVGRATFWNDVLVSTQRFVVGYVLGVLAGTSFGLLTGWFKVLHYMFEPWLAAFNATPRLALLPLIVLWVGLGFWSKVVIVFLGVFFPVAINTFHAVRTVDRRLLDVAFSFGATRRRRLLSVVFPGILPFVLVGMRIGVGRAISGVVVAEFFTSEAGLGRFILRAGLSFRTADLLFGALFITVLAMGAFKLISLLEGRLSSWRPQQQRGR